MTHVSTLRRRNARERERAASPTPWKRRVSLRAPRLALDARAKALHRLNDIRRAIAKAERNEPKACDLAGKARLARLKSERDFLVSLFET